MKAIGELLLKKFQEGMLANVNKDGNASIQIKYDHT
jgi:hypothetical protein